MAICVMCGKTIPGLGGNDYAIKDGIMCRECMADLVDAPVNKLHSKILEIEKYKELDSNAIKQILAEKKVKKAEEEAKRIEEEKKKLEEAQKILEQFKTKQKELVFKRLEHDRIAPYLNDIYEYDVVTVIDNHNGDADIYKISSVLQEHAEQGWRLISTLANEIGHTSSYSSISGMGSGTNATIDQIILIFERRIKKAKEEQ